MSKRSLRRNGAKSAIHLKPQTRARKEGKEIGKFGDSQGSIELAEALRKMSEQIRRGEGKSFIMNCTILAVCANSIRKEIGAPITDAQIIHISQSMLEVGKAVLS